MDIQPGLQVRLYRVVERLGTGACGEVWSALPTDFWSRLSSLSNPAYVAIKFANSTTMGDENVALYRAHLRSEINALSRLHHDHIPLLLEHDLSYKRPYLVMQYMGEPTLDRLIYNGDIFAIDMHRRLQVLEKVASAITAAHSAGIIHRDIKPAHISGIEHPYLLDFGLSFERNSMKQVRKNAGTVLYMPPPDEPPDEASDYYSFALTAYEILFGCHAIFAAAEPLSDATQMREFAANRLLNRTWRLPSQIPRLELPGDLYGADMGWLDGIFERALGPRKGRYADLSRFVADLKNAIFTSSNLRFLENCAVNPIMPAFAVPPIPTEELYTQHEVERAKQLTEPDNDAENQAAWHKRLLK